MSKIIAIGVATMLTLLSSCGNQTSPPASTPSTAVSTVDQMEVMVLFGGLMVFNLNPTTGSYEVGILSEENSHGHDFCVQTLGAPRVCRQTASQRSSQQEQGEWLPAGTRWTLSVNPNPPNETPVITTQSLRRRADVEGSQFDFNWIIDLDGREFHNRRLELRPGQLKPIIQLPRVALFTKYKSPDFFRLRGEQSKDVFGFVAEVIGFRVQLNRGQELTLKDEDANEVITTIPYVAPSPIGGNYQVVYITNSRFPQTRGSDFKMYYKLFSNVADEREQFDFEENTIQPCDPPREPPHQADPCVPLNPTPRKPQEKVLQDNLRTEKTSGITCCGLICTEIRLVNWNQPLH